MRILTVPALVLLLFLGGHHADAAGSDSHDSHDHEEIPNCAEFNVTADYDCHTCEAWCEGAGRSGNCETETRHADTIDDIHVDVYEGFMCECEDASEGRVLEEGDEMHCGIEHDLPTCESVGIGNCDGNSTTTCKDYCISIGLGIASSDRSLRHIERSLGHIHVCDHKDAHEEEEEDSDHEHEGEEGYTMCYCDIPIKKEGDSGAGLVSCADEGWEGEHGSHGETAEGSAAASSCATGGLLISAIAASMYFW